MIKKRKIKLSWRARRNRAIAAVLGLAILGGIAYASYKGFQKLTTSKPVPITYAYQVKNGDTLWDIANQFKDESQDVRKEVFMIAKANGLDANKPLQPGTKLKIEVYR